MSHDEIKLKLSSALLSETHLDTPTVELGHTLIDDIPSNMLLNDEVTLSCKYMPNGNLPILLVSTPSDNNRIFMVLGVIMYPNEPIAQIQAERPIERHRVLNGDGIIRGEKALNLWNATITKLTLINNILEKI